MSKIVNLRQARKQASRMKKSAKASENAALHGRDKAQKMLEATRNDKARRMLDQHEIEE